MSRSIDLPSKPDFSFISSDSSRTMIESGYRSIMKCEGWNILQNFTGESFMFSRDPSVCQLMDAVSEGYGGNHSGSSMGYTMRQLEFIAKNGFARFKAEWN